MAKTSVLMLVAGALVGFGIGYLATRGDEPAPDDAGLKDRVARLEDENGTLQRDKESAESSLRDVTTARDTALAAARDAEDRVKELTAKLAAATRAEGEGEGEGTDVAGGPDEPKAAAEVDVEALRKVASDFSAVFQKLVTGGDVEKEKKAIREAFARASPETLQAYIDEFESADLLRQFAMAHALAQSGRPEAIAALRKTLSDPDEAYMTRRMASHGLAFTDAEGIDADLARAARNDADTGVRANAAFGLARRGDPEGPRLYGEAMDTAFAKEDPEAINYVYSLSFLGEKGKPLIRERLTTYKDKRARLIMIGLTRSSKDTDALPILDRIAQADEDAEIRDAAEKAARAIRGE